MFPATPIPVLNVAATTGQSALSHDRNDCGSGRREAAETTEFARHVRLIGVASPESSANEQPACLVNSTMQRWKRKTPDNLRKESPAVATTFRRKVRSALQFGV